MRAESRGSDDVSPVPGGAIVGRFVETGGSERRCVGGANGFVVGFCAGELPGWLGIGVALEAVVPALGVPCAPGCGATVAGGAVSARRCCPRRATSPPASAEVS